MRLRRLKRYLATWSSNFQWLVLYPDGQHTYLQRYSAAKNLRDIFGGQLIWKHDAEAEKWVKRNVR